MNVTILTQKRWTKPLREFSDQEWKDVYLENFGKPVEWKSKQLCVKATVKGKIAGYAKLKIDLDVCLIRSFIIGKKYRRSGVGTKLMKTVLTVLKENNTNKAYLITGKGWKAIQFYKSLGFQKKADLPKHYLKQDFVIMSIYL